MFTKIDPLFKTLFRHAESADTREEIKRRQPEHEKRKGKEDNIDHKDSQLWEDETDVSIEALSSFLHTLLGDKDHVFNNNSGKTAPTEPSSDRKTSYAINAYKKTANEPTQSVNITESETVVEESGLSLDETTRPIVDNLLKEVEDLRKNGIEYLIISKQGTFFESVKEAIETAHDRFSL